MRLFLILSLLFCGCSFSNNSDRENKVSPPLVLEEDTSSESHNSVYFYFQRDQEFLCVKRTGNFINTYIADASTNSRDIKRFRGEILAGDTVYIEWRDYNQFDNDKHLLFEPVMGGKPDAFRSIESKRKVEECAVEAYASFDTLIEELQKESAVIDSLLFNKALNAVLAQRVFPLPKYLHLMDKYYYRLSLPNTHQQIEIRADEVEAEYYRYFSANNTGQLLSVRVRSVVWEDGRIELLNVLYPTQHDKQETLEALGELLQNYKAKSFSILGSAVKAEASLDIILNKAL